jgi:hypothetical protein
LEPDPLRESLKLTQSGVLLPSNAIGDSMETVIPLRGNNHWMMVAIENAFSVNKPIPLKIL